MMRQVSDNHLHLTAVCLVHVNDICKKQSQYSNINTPICYSINDILAKEKFDKLLKLNGITLHIQQFAHVSLVCNTFLHFLSNT